MQVKVLKRFFDKENGNKAREKDEVIQVDKKRAEMLAEKKFVEIITEKKNTEKEAAE